MASDTSSDRHVARLLTDKQVVAALLAIGMEESAISEVTVLLSHMTAALRATRDLLIGLDGFITAFCFLHCCFSAYTAPFTLAYPTMNQS